MIINHGRCTSEHKYEIEYEAYLNGSHFFVFEKKITRTFKVFLNFKKLF